MKTACPATTSPTHLATRGWLHAAAAAAAHAQGDDVDAGTLWLADGEVRALDPSETHAIRGIAGQAWVTQEGDAADVILEAGDEFRAAARGKIVVQALDGRGAALRVVRRRRDGSPAAAAHARR